MKKVIVALLMIMLVCMTSVFADTTLTMNANVADGSGATGPSTGEGEDVTTDSPVYENPNIYIYYSLNDTGSVMGGDALTTNMSSLAQNASVSGLDLVGDTDNTYDNVYLYVYASAKTSSSKSASVTFSCTNGWEYQTTASDVTAPKIPLSFSSTVATVSNGLSAQKTDTAAGDNATDSKAEYTVTAAAASNVGTAILLGKTTISWTQSADYLAGDYKAVVTVTVTAA